MTHVRRHHQHAEEGNIHESVATEPACHVRTQCVVDPIWGACQCRYGRDWNVQNLTISTRGSSYATPIRKRYHRGTELLCNAFDKPLRCQLAGGRHMEAPGSSSKQISTGCQVTNP